MHQVVKLAVGDILARPFGHELDQLELGEAQIDPLPFPESAVAVELELQIAQAADVAFLAGTAALPLGALQNEVDPLAQNGKAAGLLDKIDCPAVQSSLFIDLFAQHRQKDNRHLEPVIPQPAQNFDTVELGHAPVQQHKIGFTAILQPTEKGFPSLEGFDSEFGICQILGQSFTKKRVVINNRDP